jgi:hypothetical protein
MADAVIERAVTRADEIRQERRLAGLARSVGLDQP